MVKQTARSFLAAVLGILLLTSVPAGLAFPAYPPEGEPGAAFSGLVSLDVNPSLELNIENGVVVSAYAMNDEGQRLLLNVQPEGKTAQEAVAEIVKALADAGYLSQEKDPALIIAVSGADEQADELASLLRQSARDAASLLDGELEIRTAFVTEEIASEAAALSMSSGRYLLMKHIAKAEGISLEEAIARYGQIAIGALLAQFKDARSLFRDGDEEDLSGLTPEQLAALEAAFAAQKETILRAEKAFHDAFQAIRQAYKARIQDVKKEDEGKDAQAIQASLDQLREQMMAEYNAALQARDNAVAAARAAFREAAASAAIHEELLESFFTWHVNKELNAQNQLNGFLKEFIYHGKDGKENGNGQDNQGNTQDDPGKKREEPGKPDQNNGKKEDNDQDTSGGSSGKNDNGKPDKDNGKKPDGEKPNSGGKKK